MMEQAGRNQNRLRHYDYSQNGFYFVTICVRNHQKWFGTVVNNTTQLSIPGKIVHTQWLWLAEQYPYLSLDQFVIMPNHCHGILVINNDVGTGRDLSLHQHKIKPLSQLIGAFKTTTSKKIHQRGFHRFAWQRSFYDHVIRNERSLSAVRQYIQDNPRKWEEDEYHPSNWPRDDNNAPDHRMLE